MTNDYKTILEKRKTELAANLVHIDEILSVHNEVGFNDAAIEHEDDEVLEAQGLSGQNELIAISAALERIAKETFGICVVCEGPISKERLDIVPTAVKCRKCMD